MFVHDFPFVVGFLQADGGAHPPCLFLTVLTRSAALAEVMAEGDVPAHHDLRLVDLERHSPRRHVGEAGLPVLSVGGRALELQRHDGVVSLNAGRVGGHDGIEISGVQGTHPFVDDRQDIVTGGRFG